MRQRCGYCSTHDGLQATVTGNYICAACFPKWLSMRKRAFAGAVQQRGCTGYICDHGAIEHDTDCPMHGAA